MKKDTWMGVWEHLMNAEALANGLVIALQKKDLPNPQEQAEMDRAGWVAAAISRSRRDWEYWFIPPEVALGNSELKQQLLPFEKRWYTE